MFFFRSLLCCCVLLLGSLLISAQNPNSPDDFPCQRDARISLAFSGDTTLSTCTDDNILDRIRFQVRPFRQAHVYMVVDDQDIIQYISFSNFINFDILPSGNLRVFAFSTIYRPTARVGDNYLTTQLSQPCAGLTQNFVSVRNASTMDVTIAAAQDTFLTCPGDGIADLVSYTSPSPDAFFVITNDNGEVLAVDPTGTFDFDGGPAGTRRVYAAVNVNVAVGDDVAGFAGQGGCDGGISQNFIVVLREQLSGGEINTADGELDVLLCPTDGNPDVIDFVVSGTTGDSSRYVLTDEANVVLAVPTGSSIDFDGFADGIYRVWHVSFNGDFVATPGMNLAATDFATGCSALSGNFVLVRKEAPLADAVQTIDGEFEVATCPGDGVSDSIRITATIRGGEVNYFLTNESNLILGTSPNPVFDLENAPPGVYRIYAVAYQGTINFTGFADITTFAVSDACFDLSDNFITVNATVPSGGDVSTVGGQTDIRLCPTDGFADVVEFAVENDEGQNFSFVVTDENNVVLDVPAGATVDFEGSPLGICRLWGVAYNGNLLVSAGDQLTTAQLSDGCFGLSNNFVRVVRAEPEGGTVRLANGAGQAEICPTDGIPDILEFVSENAIGDNSAWIITDEAGQILSLPASGTIDFEGVPPGVCRVYHLVYSGALTANEDDFLDDGELASGCFALSNNFVTITRIEATTGPIATESGEAEVLVCPGDASPDFVDLDSTGTTLDNFVYLITDENDVVINATPFDRIDFENFPVGTCRVYGLGYNGLFIPTPGLIVGQDQLASGCSAVSETFVTITKQVPEGGSVTTLGGETSVRLCPMDGLPDTVRLTTTSTSAADYTYVVTDEAGTVLSIQMSTVFDFEGSPDGTCRIYGLAYQDSLLLGLGDNLFDSPLAAGCSSLSDDFVTVVREGADGGEVTLDNGDTRFVLCPDDSTQTSVNYRVSGQANLDFTFVITTDGNVVIDVTTATEFDFDTADVGAYRIWGLSYAGALTITVGDTILTGDALATGCSELSDNFIEVLLETPEGGSISLDDGTTPLDFCSGDATDDLLRFTTTSTSANYVYFITQSGRLLRQIDDDEFDFSQTLSGTYEIYGLAWTGNLSLTLLDSVTVSDLATSCFELSDNVVTLNVTNVDGGTIAGNGLDTLYFCRDNPDDGLVDLTTTSLYGNDSTYTYVVTSPTNNPVILSVIDSTTTNLGALPVMEARIYAVDFTGASRLQPGLPLFLLPLSDGCFAVSDNFITVFNDNPEGGSLSSDDLSPTGVFCAVDGDNTLSVTTTSSSLTGYAAVVIDTGGVIVLISEDPGNVDLGSLPPNDYQIIGVAYTGDLNAEAGELASDAIYSFNCFEVSDTLAVRNAGAITAGEISAVGNPNGVFDFCLNVPPAPVVLVESTAGGFGYRYVLTDADDNILFPNLPSNVVTFFGFDSGEYRIYGVNLSGTPVLQRGRSIFGTLSTECFAVTPNFITVNVSNPDGGEVTTIDGRRDTTIQIDVNGVAEIDFVTTSDSLDNYAYVVTDTADVVLSVSMTNTLDFGPAGPGTCYVYGLAYDGNLTVMAGDTLTNGPLTDGCEDLSDNFVEVTREEIPMIGNPGGTTVQNLWMTPRPNPVVGTTVWISLNSDEPLGSGTITVRDLNGQAYNVAAVQGGALDERFQLDVSGLPSGVYFVHYQSASAQLTERLVVP